MPYYSVMPLIQMRDDYEAQTPDANILATEAVMNTIRTADLLYHQIGMLLRPLNVSAAGGLVLGLLRDHGPMSPSELSERLIVTRATVTGLVDSLERRGFVRRTPDPADRRRLRIEITPSGLDVVQQVRATVHRAEKAWLAALSDAELRTYIELLHRIQDGLADAGRPGDGGPSADSRGRP